MPVSKVDFYKSYPTLMEIRPKVNGKHRHLSSELSFLKNLILKENLPDKKKLYKIAKHIHAKRGSKQFCSLLLSFIYNLFHGRWGTSESIYRQIKNVAKQYKLSDITKKSSQTVSSTSKWSPLALLHQFIQTQNKSSLQDIKDVVESEDYNWEEYLKWLKDNEPKSFSKIFQQALDGDKADLIPFLKNMNFQDLEKECSDLSNPDNCRLDLKNGEVFISKKLLSKFIPHFQTPFNGKFKDAFLNVIKLDDSYDDFKACLNLIFFGIDLEITQDNIFNYLEIANYYEIDAVKDLCEQWFLQNIKSFKIKELYSIASANSLSKEFAQKLNNFVNNKAQKALKKHNWDQGLQQKLSDLAPFVTEIDLEGIKLKNKNLSFLSIFSSLESLNLRYTEITDTDFQGVTHLQSLKSIDLYWTKVTDIGLAYLANLKSLQKLNVQALKITDDGVAHLANLPSLQSLNLQDTKITDASLGYLANLKSLQILNLKATNVTDKGLANLPALKKLNLQAVKVTDIGLEYLANVPSLQSLNLRLTKISDDGLVHLANLPLLKKLNLQWTGVTDLGLAHVANVQSLKKLNLKGLGITDAGLVHLVLLSSLQRVNLKWNKITDTGLVQLANVYSLKWLNLYAAKITNAGIAHLASLQSLQSLNLQLTGITDPGLEHLANVKSLQRVNLRETKVTDAGFSPFADLQSLRILDVRNTGIKKIRQLSHLKDLTIRYL